MSVTDAPSTAPVSATQFPTAETTGVPAGTTLTDYTGPTTITQDNTVIEGARFGPDVRTINVQAANVTIRNSRFEIIGYHCISMDDAYVGTASLTLENCEFVGPWSQPDSDYDDLSCTVRGSGWSMYGCHVHGYGDGIHPDGDNVIQGNYIADFGWSGNDADHIDGSQSLGGTSHIHFIGNAILVQLTQSVAGAIQFGTEYGGYDDVLVQGNQIAGGAWALYAGEDPHSDPPVHSTNVRILDNDFSTMFWPLCGQYGVCVYWNSNGEGNQWSGNTFDGVTEVPPPDGGAPTPPEPPEPPPVGETESIFTDQTPVITDNADRGPLSVGTRFFSTVAGAVAGVRFYAPDTVAGDGEVSLWDVSSGDLLASASFSAKSLCPARWNEVEFDAPISVRANQLLSSQVYWSSESPRYVATRDFFSRQNGDYVTNGSLSAVDTSGRNGHINGVFSYTVDPVLATDTVNAFSYFVDTLFVEGGGAAAMSRPAATGTSNSLPAARTPAAATGAVGGAGTGVGADRTGTTIVILALQRRKIDGLRNWATDHGLSIDDLVALAVNQFLEPVVRGRPGRGGPRRHLGRVGRGLRVELALSPRRRTELIQRARERGVRVGDIVLESLEQYLRQHSTHGPDQLPT